MYLYVELWKPRPEWVNLPREQRDEFLSQVAKGIDRMQELDVELIGFSLCDEETPHHSDFRYVAVWKMPNLGHVHMLEKAIKKEGWENFFDIINARGAIKPVSALMEDMVKV
ncbi:MAG: DUF6616 family protein [Saprospiraceae bacterium]